MAREIRPYLQIVRVRHLFYPHMPRDYFYELSSQQGMSGNEVDVLTWNRNGNCVEEVTEDGFVVHRLPGLNINFGGLIEEYPYLPKLPAEIDRLRPDVVHAESHLFLTTVQAVRTAKKLNLPCVVTVHGVSAERGLALNLAQSVYLRTLGSEVLKDANRVVCLTHADELNVVRLGCPSNRIVLIPNAVDVELFKPCKERNDNLVVWAGRFVPEKGLEYLVEAAEIVADRVDDIKFLLIGYGSFVGKIMKLVHNRGLSRVIRFAGPLRRDEIAEILGKATVFAFPSLKEGLPLSVLEAMASGVPVVCSDISGVNEAIINKKNGLLVPAKDSKKLALAILRLIVDSDLRSRLGRNARELAIAKYNWPKIIEKIQKVYFEAINDAS